MRFRYRARNYLEHTSDIAWRRDTPWGAVYAVLGYDLGVELVSTYIYRLRRRGDESALFADLADSLRAQVPAVSAPPLQLVRDRILPLLRRTSALPPAEGYRPENRFVRSSLDEEVRIAYIIEGQHRYTFVTEGMQTAWGMDSSALHSLALSNLRIRTVHVLEELGGPQAEYVSLDGLDAARALVPELVIPPGIPQPVLAIPHEHACLIADLSRREQLAARAAALFRDAQVPLSPRLYRVTSEGLQLEPSPSSQSSTAVDSGATTP